MNTFEQVYEEYRSGYITRAQVAEWCINKGDSPVRALYSIDVLSDSNERASAWIRAMNHFDHHNFAAFDMEHDSLYKGIVYD